MGKTYKEILVEEQEGLCAYCGENVEGKSLRNNTDYGVICVDCSKEIGGGERELRTFGDRADVWDAYKRLDKFTETIKNDKKNYPTTVRGDDTLADRLLVYDTLCVKIEEEIENFIESTNRDYVPGVFRVDDSGYYDGVNRLEVLGDLLDTQARRYEHKKAEETPKLLSREELEELERQYTDIPDGAVSMQDIYDYFTTKVEKGEMTKVTAVNEIMSYKECAYRFCYNVFDERKKHGRTRYCCPNHAEQEKNAKDRFRRIGTYLPRHAYDINTKKTIEDDISLHETAFDHEFIGNCSKEEGELFARRPKGDMDTRNKRREVKSRMNYRKEIDEQLEEYRAFKSGSGTPVMRVIIETGEILRGNESHKGRGNRGFPTPYF